MELFTFRALLSSLLVSMAVLALTSSSVDAKKCKAKKSKHFQANVSVSTGVSVSVGHGKQTFFKGGKGGKAGLAGGQSMKHMKECVNWFKDWTPDPFASNEWAREDKSIEGVSMLWGPGWLDHDDDYKRFEAFKKLPKGKYKVIAFWNEFDFKGVGSSGPMSVQDALAAWEQWIVPHRREAGALLIGPSCAMQDHETQCSEFVKKAKSKPDAISVHIFKDTVDGVKKVLDHYRKLGLPMIITELACINYEGGGARFCSQGEMYPWWEQVIKIMEEDDDVVGYSPSDAHNGDAAKLTADNGDLSETGRLIKKHLCRYNGKRG